MSEQAWIAIAPMRIELLQSYNSCVGSVAREKKYLRFTDTPPLEGSREFVKTILERHFPMWVALIPGPTVIGWCDIGPSQFESEAHTGSLGIGVHPDYRGQFRPGRSGSSPLGIGVHPDYRGQGIGRLLMERALKQARTCRIERVGLDVYSSNLRAIELYKSLDFEEEGIRRRARKVDGIYEDIILMVRHI